MALQSAPMSRHLFHLQRYHASTRVHLVFPLLFLVMMMMMMMKMVPILLLLRLLIPGHHVTVTLITSLSLTANSWMIVNWI